MKAIVRPLSRNRRWTLGAVSMAAAAAIACIAGLPPWSALAIGLAVGLTGLVALQLVERRRGNRRAAVRARSPEPDFDAEEVIFQDATSGRLWRVGDVHYLSASDKRRLAAERPHVWKAYRARLFPLSEGPGP